MYCSFALRLIKLREVGVGQVPKRVVIRNLSDRSQGTIQVLREPLTFLIAWGGLLTCAIHKWSRNGERHRNGHRGDQSPRKRGSQRDGRRDHVGSVSPSLVVSVTRTRSRRRAGQAATAVPPKIMSPAIQSHMTSGFTNMETLATRLVSIVRMIA